MRPDRKKSFGWPWRPVFAGFCNKHARVTLLKSCVSIYFDRHIEFNYDKGPQDGCDGPEQMKVAGYLGSLTMNDPLFYIYKIKK